MSQFQVPQCSAYALDVPSFLVVKVGTALIADPKTGEIRTSWIDSLIEDVVRLSARGQKVVIVTSGAATVGWHRIRHLGWERATAKQAAAAIGQVQILQAYAQSLKRRGSEVGQLLLTRKDVDENHRRLHVREVLQKLLMAGAIPVVNESYTTTSADTCFGDNDRLAAHVAEILEADLLVLLSNVDGLFTGDPNVNPSARFVKEVRCITPEIEAMAAPSLTCHSSGGMVTKLMAAKIAMDAGCEMMIANGTGHYPLTAVERGAPSTRFIPIAKQHCTGT
ncbi:glutamate 5-kinase [Sinorhizobium meliloti]|uniref:glutamate 5-kinase n=1 Tax=Rhizobium meliloti TaxID=382 RepID=UPI000B499CB4|nr:glutamate 5-kinase [Sinorhizobium meliloti]ASP91678.1 glutamate 5-kinase [Sinorhizobium meliloti]MQX56176.1 glutamate 5-kinase [Sinorhizobium meliloti]